MTIDDDLLNKLEKLSAIKTDDSRRENFKKELESILDFVDILNNLDLRDENLGDTTKQHTPLRDDLPSHSNQDMIEVVFKNAPNAKDSFFVVPKILD